MKSRKDFVESLRSNEQYKRALASARTPAERKAVADMVEGMVGGFAEILGPLIARAESDPAFAEQLGRSLVEKRVVLSASDPATSGSIG